MRQLYTFVLTLLIPFILVKLWLRGRKAPAYRQRWAERFGFFSQIQTQDTIWVHAVSVGEVQAASPLIIALKQRYPQFPIVVTTMTPTGLAQVKTRFSETVVSGHLPYDLPVAIDCFLKRARPAVAIVMETELWPNLFYACKKKSIPLMIANGRLSPRSTRGYQRIKPFVVQTLKNVSCIAAQSEADAKRFVGIGAAPERVIVMKNIKFDIAAPQGQEERVHEFRSALGLQRKVWIAASTHAGEDELVLDIHRQLLQTLPDAVLLLVPRHPERFNDVANLVRQRGFTFDRRSESVVGRAQTQVFIGDSMGELMFYFQAADLAFVGGSFVPTGGHNILEPAAIGLATLVGPHTFNFKDITESMVAAGATLQVETVEQLELQISALLKDESSCRAMGQRGQQVVEVNRGATEVLLRQIDTLLVAKSKAT